MFAGHPNILGSRNERASRHSSTARTDGRFRLTIAHPLQQSRILRIGQRSGGCSPIIPLSFLGQANPNSRLWPTTEDPACGAETSALYRNIGTIWLHRPVKSLKTLDSPHGRHRAVHCRMPSDNDGWSRVEQLVEELRAIDYWDANYRRSPHTEAYEMLAFVARRKRHAEILSRLIAHIPPLVMSEKELRIVGRSNQTAGGRTNVTGGSN